MNNPSKLKSIFFHALERSSSDERVAFLDEVCAGNNELRRHVERMLAAQSVAGSFLESPAPGLDVSQFEPPVTERPGTIIGPYKLLEQIGEGGFGVVFMAEQAQPIQRKVALKVVKPGMDSKQVLARFDAERHALALMDHANIARVLDAGTTETGRPYFVMELVRGTPVTDYCDQHRLSIRERLELFVTICQAVQHAHQKGIIHRDLKPTNVLVTQHDGRPLAKVIDFGVAKATGQKLTDKTLFTGFAQLIGTPLYMSPEQAELSEPDVDTRSDIYSLGVLFYELLTGSTPFETERLKAAAFDEMRRIIREEEPPRPSTRISTLAQQAISTVSEKRNSDPRHLSRLFQGELDWIAMKTLDKDRNRRYETASALADDIEHYLHDEPVQACPPSKSYRLRKFARRNRIALCTASLVTAALVLGMVVSTWQAIRAFHAEQQAREATDSEHKAKTAESTQRQQAEENSRRAEAVLNLMVDTFRSPDPWRDGRKITIAEVLDRAAKDVQDKFADDPRAKVTMLLAIAQTYEGLGLYHEAVPLFEQARDLCIEKLGKDHPDTLKSMDKLAAAYGVAGRLNEAVALAEKTLQLRKAKLPAGDPEVLSSMSKLARVYIEVGQGIKAVPLFEKVLELRTAKLGENDPETLSTMEELADAYPHERANEAVALCEKSVSHWKAKLGPGATDTLISMNRLAVAYREVGRVNDAIPLNEETLQLLKEKLGPENPHTLACKENLARAYQKAGRLDEALPLFEEVLQAYRNMLSTGHVDTLWAIDGLADAYQAAGRWAEAIPLLEEGVLINGAMRSPDHRETLWSMWRLADSYQRVGRFDEAIPLIEANFKSLEATLGPNHLGTNPVLSHLVEAYRLAGRPDEGLVLLTDVLNRSKVKLGPGDPETIGRMWDVIKANEIAGRLGDVISLKKELLDQLKQSRGPTHPETIGTMHSMADTYEAAGRLDEALGVNQEELQLQIAKAGPHSPETLEPTNRVAIVLIRQGKLGEADALLRDHLETLRAAMAPEITAFATRLNHLALVLLLQQRFAEAEPLAREALEIREKQTPDNWPTFNSRSLLGGALQGQQKYAEAEPLLVSGYEGLQQREAMIPATFKLCLRQALARIVQLYEATSQPGRAAIWKEKLNDLGKEKIKNALSE